VRPLGGRPCLWVSWHSWQASNAADIEPQHLMLQLDFMLI
jgi:hypothetical protein